MRVGEVMLTPCHGRAEQGTDALPGPRGGGGGGGMAPWAPPPDLPPPPSPRASFEQGGEGGRGGGGFGPKTWCTKNGLTRFSRL